MAEGGFEFNRTCCGYHSHGRDADAVVARDTAYA